MDAQLILAAEDDHQRQHQRRRLRPRGHRPRHRHRHPGRQGPRGHRPPARGHRRAAHQHVPRHRVRRGPGPHRPRRRLHLHLMSAVSSASCSPSTEGEEAKNPLIPNANELFWGTICFAIFAALHDQVRAARGPQGARASARPASRASSRRPSATATRRRQLLEQYRAAARRGAQRGRSHPHRGAGPARADRRGGARPRPATEAARITEAATAQIASERQQVARRAASRGRRRWPSTLAGRVVGESLEDEARQRRTVERFLDGLEDAAPAARPRDGPLMQGASRAAARGRARRASRSRSPLPSGAGSSEVSEGLYAVAALLDREPSLRRALHRPGRSPDAPARAGRARCSARQLGAAAARGAVRPGRRSAGAQPGRPARGRRGARRHRRAARGRGATACSTTSRTSCSASPACSSASRRCAPRSPTPACRTTARPALLRELLGGRAQPADRCAWSRSRSPARAAARSRPRSTSCRRPGRRSAASAAWPQVRVARPLEPAAGGAARRRARARSTAGRSQLQVDVDPAVLGGIEVRVGDEVLDGTVQRNLADVRRRLAG